MPRWRTSSSWPIDVSHSRGLGRIGRIGTERGPTGVLKRTVGFWNRMRPEVKNRSPEGRWRAVVEGILRWFSAAQGAVRLPWERRDARKRRSTTAPAVRFCGDGVDFARRAGRLVLKRHRHYLALTNASYQLPPVLYSDCHVFRRVVNCRFSA
eukprot:6192369-Pleurochrysis_carterae.AAC.3